MFNRKSDENDDLEAIYGEAVERAENIVQSRERLMELQIENAKQLAALSGVFYAQLYRTLEANDLPTDAAETGMQIYLAAQLGVQIV